MNFSILAILRVRVLAVPIILKFAGTGVLHAATGEKDSELLRRLRDDLPRAPDDISVCFLAFSNQGSKVRLIALKDLRRREGTI